MGHSAQQPPFAPPPSEAAIVIGGGCGCCGGGGSGDAARGGRDVGADGVGDEVGGGDDRVLRALSGRQRHQPVVFGRRKRRRGRVGGGIAA